jgi:hypothetical protein
MASNVRSSCLTIVTEASSGPAKPPIRSTVGSAVDGAGTEAASMTVPFSVKPTARVSAQASGRIERRPMIVNGAEGTPEVRLAFVVAQQGTRLSDFSDIGNFAAHEVPVN